MFDQPAAFIDLETTDKDPEVARIVEISIIKIMPSSGRDSRTMRLNPDIMIPKEASDIHGITDEMVKDQPRFAQIAKALIGHLADCSYLFHFNGNHYDMPVLVAEFHRAGVEWDYTKYLSIDACTIFKRKEERTLTAAVKFYLDKSHEDAHGAQADTEATIDVFAAQMDRYADLKQMTLEELALYSNYDKKAVDIAGKLYYNESNRVCISFGKHKDKDLYRVFKEDPRYFDWLLGPKCEMSKDFKNWIRRLTAHFS